jgi:hypothetical protein
LVLLNRNVLPSHVSAIRRWSPVVEVVEEQMNECACLEVQCVIISRDLNGANCWTIGLRLNGGRDHGDLNAFEEKSAVQSLCVGHGQVYENRVSTAYQQTEKETTTFSESEDTS